MVDKIAGRSRNSRY